MHYTYLAEHALEGDEPWHLLALPIPDPGDQPAPADGEAPPSVYALDLTTGTEWTPWFVDVPAAAATIELDEVRRLAGSVGLPPDAEVSAPATGPE